MLPTGRFGNPNELANLATYIVSDYASWLTGAIIDLDGGELVYRSGSFNMLSRVRPIFAV